MKSHLYRLSLLGSVLAALSLNVAVADDVAKHKFITDSITVSYEDLNLSNSAGLNNLYRRVEFAARRVCGVENFRVSLDIMRKNQECVTSSINKAIGQVGDARLTVLHQQKLLLANRS